MSLTSLTSLSSHGVAPDAQADPPASAVTLAEWGETVPVYGWWTFEYTTRAGNQWSVEPPPPGGPDYRALLHATISRAPDFGAAAWVEQSRYPLKHPSVLCARAACSVPPPQA